MSEEKNAKQATGETVTAEQAAQVGGGDGDCGSTMSIGGLTSPTPTFGEAVTEVYDGAVDATSHIIERVVKAF